MAKGRGWGAGFFKARYVWMVFSAIFVVVLIGFLLHCIRLRNMLMQVEGERKVLLAQLEASPRPPFLTRWDIAQMERQGLSNPEKDLAVNLMQHRELIPYKGVMGGTMGFYSKKDIHILSSRWVLAAFEDGHISGHMLLEYTVSPGGEIQWKVIAAYLD